MHRSRAIVSIAVTAVAACGTGSVAAPLSAMVTYYRLKMPDGETDIAQASALHYGKLGEREGLWLVCDRNGGSCGNRIMFIGRQRLQHARPGGNVSADEAFVLAGPWHGWDRFIREHDGIDVAVLSELRRQFDNGVSGGKPILDLEAITIGRSRTPDSPMRLFVVTEQPHSVVLELELDADNEKRRAFLADCFAYKEQPSERGGDANDGIEGICWSGSPGAFFIAEEGTRPFRPNDLLHFFDHPRLMRCVLEKGQVRVDGPWSSSATRSVRALSSKSTHTLNDLAAWDSRTVLAVDRNGGWILAVDVPSGGVRRWLNLYDPKLLNLRQRLAQFPGPRRMPYVSIEGLTRDADGHLWMVDDPAMPEAFRESCLVRLKHPPALPRPSSGPARDCTP